MKIGQRWFQITGIFVLVQLILGVLVSYGFIDSLSHIILGSLVVLIAGATMVVALLSNPSSRPLKVVSSVLVSLLVLQIPLGFGAPNSSALMWAHLANAIAIIGTVFAGNVVARSWESMMGAR